MKKKIPNLLTLLRMACVPALIWFLFWYRPVSQGYLWGLILFVAASISDYLDGFLARRWNIISNFGKIMDPLADKLVVVTSILALSIGPWKLFGLWVVIVVVVREVAVTIRRNYYSRKNIFIPANIWGKIKTFTQMTGIIAALAFYSLSPYLDFLQQNNSTIETVLRVCFWLIALVTVLSGVTYFMPHKKESG